MKIMGDIFSIYASVYRKMVFIVSFESFVLCREVALYSFVDVKGLLKKTKKIKVSP